MLLKFDLKIGTNFLFNFVSIDLLKSHNPLKGKYYYTAAFL